MLWPLPRRLVRIYIRLLWVTPPLLFASLYSKQLIFSAFFCVSRNRSRLCSSWTPIPVAMVGKARRSTMLQRKYRHIFRVLPPVPLPLGIVSDWPNTGTRCINARSWIFFFVMKKRKRPKSRHLMFLVDKHLTTTPSRTFVEKTANSIRLFVLYLKCKGDCPGDTFLVEFPGAPFCPWPEQCESDHWHHRMQITSAVDCWCSVPSDVVYLPGYWCSPRGDFCMRYGLGGKGGQIKTVVWNMVNSSRRNIIWDWDKWLFIRSVKSTSGSRWSEAGSNSIGVDNIGYRW